MIIIESKRKKPATILRQYPNAVLADVTSGAKDDLVKLSPFYPHGGIPVPFSEGYTATCVESIWQGLKVFEAADVDTSLFLNDTMKGLKRTVRRYGKPLGHRKGVNGTDLLGYIEARKQIYIPTYRWVLENKVQSIIERMREASKEIYVGIVKVLGSQFYGMTQKEISTAIALAPNTRPPAYSLHQPELLLEREKPRRKVGSD